MKTPITPGPSIRARLLVWGLLAAAATASVTAADLPRAGLRLDAGSLFSLSGKYSATETLRETVIAGAGLGLAFRYRILSNVLLEAGYGYNWMFIRKDKRPSGTSDDKPALILPFYTLNATVFLTTKGSFQPFLTAGVGWCPWRFADQPFRGNIWAAPADDSEDFAKRSPLLGAGLGFELIPWSRVSLIAEAKYLYLFAADAERFGESGFGGQGFLGVRLGLAYSFGPRRPKASRKRIRNEPPVRPAKPLLPGPLNPGSGYPPDFFPRRLQEPDEPGRGRGGRHRRHQRLRRDPGHLDGRRLTASRSASRRRSRSTT